jgi:PAS domain S-box-containing protein
MENGDVGRRPFSPVNGLSHLNDSEQVFACAVVMLDRTACVTDWNDEAERLFGYSAKTAIGKPFYHFLELESLTPGSVEWELLTAYYRGTSTCIRQYTHSDGSHFRATAEVVPLWDGDFLGYRLTFSSVNTHTNNVPMNGLSDDYSTVV